MRFPLNLTYVYLRGCEGDVNGSKLWVGWCPELDVQVRGYGLPTTAWMIRDAVRRTLADCVASNTHPLRRRPTPPPDGSDPDWTAYQQFRSHVDDPTSDYGRREWSTESRLSQVPDSVETCFQNVPVWVSTSTGLCAVDEEYGWGEPVQYRSGRTVRVKVLVETTWEVQAHQLTGPTPTLADMRNLYGTQVREILDWEEID